MNVMNETDSVTHVLLYGKDFFRGEVNLLISNVATDFVVFKKELINLFIVSDLQDYLSVFAVIVKNLI